jgi:hypothetical protein
MNVRHSRLARLVALTVVVSMPILGMAGVASAKKAGPNFCKNHPNSKRAICTGSSSSGGGGATGTGNVQIAVTADPNPLVETGQSEIHTVIQVETLPSFAGDVVSISSSQLVASCLAVSYEDIQNGLPPHFSPDRTTLVLDDDGNATVLVDAINCAPGTDIIEADLEQAPYLTALTTLTALPPAVTTPGVVGYPNPEVETGDTFTGINGASGNSDVYAVFYVEDSPVYAEQTVEIGSSQLEARCGEGWRWEAGNFGTTIFDNPAAPGAPGNVNGGAPGPNTGPEVQTTLDDDGNAVFAFKGISCAAGDSTVIADVEAGTHDTFVTTYTITAPEPTI